MPKVDTAWYSRITWCPTLNEVTATNQALRMVGCMSKMDLSMTDVSEAPRNAALLIHTDSELLVKTVNGYISTWVKNGYVKRDGKGFANKDLVKR
jgi:ribonuclease HI